MIAASSSPPPLPPDAEKRIAQARRNYEFYQQVRDESQYLDWGMTLLFYTALHLVDAHAILHGRVVSFDGDIFRDHGERRHYVELSLNRISGDYRKLQDRSRDARYRLYLPTPEAVDREHDTGRFRRIVTALEAFGIRL